LGVTTLASIKVLKAQVALRVTGRRTKERSTPSRAEEKAMKKEALYVAVCLVAIFAPLLLGKKNIAVAIKLFWLKFVHERR
jgi:hypothetical protein